jgi:pyruvate dehydrogenase E2 component (dihydrolipoamide acetyltransferase)
MLYSHLTMGHLLRVEKWAENLDEVTLNRWLKAEGDTLAVGDSLCEIITDKATFEYEMEVAGTLRARYATDKSVIPVGYAIAFVGEAEEALPEGVEEENRRLLTEHQAAAQVDVDLKARLAAKLGGARVRATPAARRVAREQSVALEDVAAWLGEDRPVDDADVRRYMQERL